MLGTWLLLIGGFNPSEKYEIQMGLLFPIYGKITMFQATNQIALVSLGEQVSYENFIHTYLCIQWLQGWMLGRFHGGVYVNLVEEM